jgi:hypothetical protein
MSKSTPKAPDYTAAAIAQGNASRDVTEQQTWANRPDQYTPFGSQTWQNAPQYDPATGQTLNRWTQTTTLAPEAQRALDAQMMLESGRSELGASLFPRAQQEFGQAMDWSRFQQGGGVPQAGMLTPEQLQRGYAIQGPALDPSQRYSNQANEAIYNQWASRALPQQERDTNALRTRLYNMGLREGDAVYDDEVRKLRETQNDAARQAAYQATIGSGAEAQRYLGMDAATRAQLTGEQRDLAGFGNQAALGQFGMGAQAGQQNYGQQLQSSQYQTQLRQQQIAEEMQRRGFSLNEINALISGQQVGMPTMPGFNQAQRAEVPQFLQAAGMQGQSALDAYNARQAGLQGMLSGFGSLGSGFMMSDRRFKQTVRRIGSTPAGTPLYSFRYIFGGPEMVGVMADEVPHAVMKIAGISFVDYSKVK